MAKRGEAIDYKIDAETAASLNNRVSVDDVYPLLVVSVDDNGNVTGPVFLPDGTTHFVREHVPAETPLPPAENKPFAVAQDTAANPVDEGIHQ